MSYDWFVLDLRNTRHDFVIDVGHLAEIADSLLDIASILIHCFFTEAGEQ